MKRWSSAALIGTCTLVLAGTACAAPGVAPTRTVDAGSSASAPAPRTSPHATHSAAQPSRSTPQPSPPFTSDRDFARATFTRPTEITNRFLPLQPGTQLTWKGHAYDEGDKIQRAIVLSVTDLTKVINGVRTRVAWERDYTDGELEEIELTYYAQDDRGAVWYFGEYSEEYDGGHLTKSPHWLAGLKGARAGVMMQPAPRAGTEDYAEGWGPAVDWTDRARVDQTGVRTCVPAGCYTDVTVIDEFNPDEPGRHQLKYYAPGVGGVRTGWRGKQEVEREELGLITHETLSPPELASVRTSVLAEEKRAYQRSPSVYGRTRPMERLA